jgi:hypothetical protein
MRQEPSTRAYLICYALWLATSALLLLDANLVWLWVREAYVSLQLDRWGYAAVYEFSLVIIGMIWLSAVIVFEFRFRRWLEKGRLWQRFRVVAVIALIPPLLRLVTSVL